MKVRDIYLEFIERRDMEISDSKIYELIWQLDAEMYDAVISRSIDCNVERPDVYIFGADDETEVLLSQKYKEMYINYISAYGNYEYKDDEAYSNDMILFNEQRTEFESEYLSNHRPKKRWEFKV